MMNKLCKSVCVIALTLGIVSIYGCPEELEAPVSTSSEANTAVQTSSAGVAPTKVHNPKIGKKGGTRILSTTSPPKTFNVYLAAETSSTEILYRIYNGLVKTNFVTTVVEPDLAEKWEVKPDKCTYIMKLRKGLKWSDGKPLTSDDVVFTYNEIINNPDVSNNFRDSIVVDGKFPTVTKIDDLTIQFVTSKPFAPFLRNLENPIMPKHILGATTKKDSSGNVLFNQMWSLNSDVTKIVCNGPFKIGRYVPGQRILLVRNEYYYKKDKEGNQLPYMDSINFEIVKDRDVELIKFRAGEIDNYAMRGQDFELLKPEEKKGKFTVYDAGPGTGTEFVMFNMTTAKKENGRPIINPIKTAWFKNIKFRQALAHAIDKQTIIRSVYRNLAIPQISDISHQNPFYYPNVPVYDYNMEKAAKMLEEAGFKKNDQGELRDPKGNKVEFDLVTNTGNNVRDALCSIIRQDWTSLGIKVNYRPVQFNLMVQQIDETLDWEAMMIGLTGSAIEPHSGINVWRRNGHMHMFNMGAKKGTSYDPWEENVEKLYELGSMTLDLKKRKEVYNKAQVLVAENIPFLFTVCQFRLGAVRNNIGNIFYTIYPDTPLVSSMWNPEEQYILTDK